MNLTPHSNLPETKSISVEFYGTARLDAQLTRLTLEHHADMTLHDLLRQVEERLPYVEGKILTESGLAPGLIANLDGNSFTSDLDQDLSRIASVLIMSIDVGG